MNNGEQKESLNSQDELNNWMPDIQSPESPEHNLSELGGQAMENAIISSAPDLETNTLSSKENLFEITEVSPDKKPTLSQDQDSDSTEPNRLVFEPQDIAPREDGLSPSAETAVKNIQELITRDDNPRDGYKNYQALRDTINGGQPKWLSLGW